MSKTIYFWYRGEKPTKGEVICESVETDGEEEFDFLEIKTKYVTAFFNKEKGTDQWYDDNANEVFISTKPPKYKKPEPRFPLYD